MFCAERWAFFFFGRRELKNVQLLENHKLYQAAEVPNNNNNNAAEDKLILNDHQTLD